MIITKGHAKRLIKAVAACYAYGDDEESSIVNHNGERYVTITRYDVQRVDHYIYAEPRRKAKKTKTKKTKKGKKKCNSR